MKEYIARIHQSGHKIVVITTGGGAGAIHELTRYGGASGSLVGGLVPYASEYTHRILSRTPEHYVCAAVAIDFANNARQKAFELDLEAVEEQGIGIGATCSLAKSTAERPGRIHHLYLAVNSYSMERCYHYFMDGTSSREEEEEIVSQLILGVIGMACGIDRIPVPNNVRLEDHFVT